MGEVDRRGFMGLLRRKDAAAKETEAPEPAEPTENERQIAELADHTARLLADVEAENDELLAGEALVSKAHDLGYMRVTSGHIVYSIATGYSAIVKTGDVTAFETHPPEENKAHENLVIGVLRFHHPAEMPNMTRSFGFRFPQDSPLMPAIRSACNLPEPEPEPEPDETLEDPEGTDAEWK
jgi:hypothetical protein